MKETDLEIIYSKDNETIEKDSTSCISCGYCVKTCRDEATVARMYDISQSIEPICIHCGQCVNLCPVESIHEKFDYLNLKRQLKDSSKVKTVSIAPAVRVAISEEFGIPHTNLAAKLVTALKRLGFDYVFDITFGADLTIMEEASELVSRIQNQERLSLFTSCCPAWVRYAEIFYPELLPNLSTCKSPIAMQSTMIKTYFAKQRGVDASDIQNVVIAPCMAKKSEIKRPELNCAKEGVFDTDFSLTTRELAMWLKEEKIDLASLPESSFDSPLGIGSSAGLIFANSGGVCEAALRTAYYFLTGNNLKKEEITIRSAHGLDGIKEVSLSCGDVSIKAAIVNGMKHVKELLDRIQSGESSYQFIEVMSCPGGCIGGGGQPKTTLLDMEKNKKERMGVIYRIDEASTLRLCHENPEIKEIYESFLEYPNSTLAHRYLHTTYQDRSNLLRRKEYESSR